VIKVSRNLKYSTLNTGDRENSLVESPNSLRGAGRIKKIIGSSYRESLFSNINGPLLGTVIEVSQMMVEYRLNNLNSYDKDGVNKSLKGYLCYIKIDSVSVVEPSPDMFLDEQENKKFKDSFTDMHGMYAPRNEGEQRKPEIGERVKVYKTDYVSDSGEPIKGFYELYTEKNNFSDQREQKTSLTNQEKNNITNNSEQADGSAVPSPKFLGVGEETKIDSPTWNKTVNAPIKSLPNERNRQTYEAVIKQFKVATNQRYTPRVLNNSGKRATFCNAFLSDVSLAMNSYIPVYASEFVSQGVGGADSQSMWLDKYGKDYGWNEVSKEKAQEYANLGFPTVVVWPGGGHVGVIRPGEINANGPALAQAGASCFDNKNVANGFGGGPYKSGALKYWTNLTGFKEPEASSVQQTSSDTQQSSLVAGTETPRVGDANG
jgi:hypothetical protein